MKKSIQYILAIETSCDETSAAVLAFSTPRKRKTANCKLLSHVISSQAKLHAVYGGVVPMLAAREQQKNIEPVLNETLGSANLALGDMDYFAVTRGPGLIPSLHVGVNYARAIAFAMRRPLLGINHLEGHIYSNWLPIREFPISNFQFSNKQGVDSKKIKSSNHIATLSLRHPPVFPILNLIVSGGHTELVLMKSHGEYSIIGETLDDAAGEAFDKVARMLHLPYPGGPALAKLGEKGNPRAFHFPRPMIAAKNFNFSFSGLKTSVLYTLQKLFPQHGSEQAAVSRKLKTDVCASFEQAAVDVLVEKTLRAAKRYSVRGICISGGVSANKKLRKTFAERISKEFPTVLYRHPERIYTGDNAAMIAMAAYYQITKNRWSEVVADANARIDGR